MAKLQRIALVDLSHLTRSAFEASAGEAERGGFDAGVDGVHRIDQGGSYDAVAICIDSPPYLRTESYPSYKANREEVDEAYGPIYRRVIEHLRDEGYPIFGAKGFEADDVIATLVAKHITPLRIECDVYTNDKDIMQVVGKRTHVVSTRNGDIFGPNEVMKKFVMPKQMPDYLALVGDRSDNVPGCPGVGHVAAVRLLNALPTLADILTAAAKGRLAVAGITQRQTENLRDYATQINESLALVTLMNDAPIVWDLIHGGGVEQPASQQEQPIVHEPETLPPPPEADEVRGNALVGGALARPEGPGLAKAEPREEAGAYRSEAATGIQLAPGVILTPGNYTLMQKMATDFHASGLYSSKFNSPPALFAVMELGLELGLPPSVALQNFAIIDGKPSPLSHYIIARGQQDPNCEYFECIETTDTHATYAIKKRTYPEELRFTYTWDMAKQAGLTGGYAWKKYPQAMIRKCAGVAACRAHFPGACAGLYSPAEMGHDETDIAA